MLSKSASFKTRGVPYENIGAHTLNNTTKVSGKYLLPLGSCPWNQKWPCPNTRLVSCCCWSWGRAVCRLLSLMSEGASVGSPGPWSWNSVCFGTGNTISCLGGVPPPLFWLLLVFKFLNLESFPDWWHSWLHLATKEHAALWIMHGFSLSMCRCLCI